MEVAARAGVSRTTASFVLSGRRDMRISADAQQRVLQAARELSYRPNLLARSLRTNLSQTIGVISDVIASEPFAGEFVRGSVATALLHQHLLFVGETEGDPEVERQLVQAMLDRGVAGFIYATMYTREVTPTKSLPGHPLVFLNCVPAGDEGPSVLPDEHAAGRLAAQILVDAGHDDGIFLIGESPAHVLAGRQRLAGVVEYLTDQGLSLAGHENPLWWPEQSFAAVTRLIADGARPTALICLNDRIAMGAYRALRNAGLRIPDDVSVISFDDSDLAGWLDPGLTSIAIPHFEMGRRAVELLLQQPTDAAVHRVEMPLRERGSVGPPISRPRAVLAPAPVRDDRPEELTSAG